MNLPPGAPAAPNPQLLAATELVVQVTRDLESLLPWAQDGLVRVSETRLEGWLTSLQTAVTYLQRIPIIAIYPPPPIARFINGAVERIERAIAKLEAIPRASPRVGGSRIYPGERSWAITLRQLHSILRDLHGALAYLFRALQTS